MEKITDTVTWVGCNDKDIEYFENQYHVKNGMAYNSYLIDDGKTVLFDTTDQRKEDEWIENVQTALNGKPLDYLIVQHLEPDHSASIDDILKLHPEAVVVASVKAWDMMPNFIETVIPEDKKIKVKDKDTLDLGTRTLTFVTAPMVHWPEVILTYDDKDKILFSADGFGKFGTRDADEPWTDDARRYYLNIVGKYGKQVQAVLKKVDGLEIKKLCSLHGPVVEEEQIPEVLELYQKWSTYTPEIDGVFIAVASIHGHTNLVADKMKELLEAKGVQVKLMDLDKDDVHEAVASAFQYSKLLLIACSYDAGVFPPMERFLTILSHKAFQNRTVGVIENGSWAPSAAKTMKEILAKNAGLQYVEPVVTIRTSMKEADLPKLQELADALSA